MFSTFQGTVGSYLGFGSDVTITRQLMNLLFRQMVVPDPEIQVCLLSLLTFSMSFSVFDILLHVYLT